MPTGGVDETNAAAYLRAGAVGVAVGGRLVAEDAVERPSSISSNPTTATSSGTR